MATACIHHAIPQPSICEVCAVAVAHRRGRRRGAIVIVALLVPVAALIAYLETRPATPKPPPEEPDFVIKNQRARLAKDPCDLKTRADHVQRLMELARWEEALAAAHAAIGCGVTGRMKWTVVALNQRLHRWFPTAVATTELINDDPLDSDFWWWRGEAWVDGNLPRTALADYRQSLANSYGAQPASFAAWRVWTPAKALKEPCEAARAWRYYALRFEGDLSQEMRDEAAAMQRAHACDAERGTGMAELGGKVRTTIEGVTGTFEVDPSTGTTVVTRMFAAKIGLETITTELGATVVHGKPVLGEPLRLKRVSAGGVAAADVDALLVDELAPGVDGVLGLSFLWHFDFAPFGDGARVSAPKARDDL